ncbi:MAG: hypothetical protein AAF657_14800 [Acidobacteriota bacterium]
MLKKITLLALLLLAVPAFAADTDTALSEPAAAEDVESTPQAVEAIEQELPGAKAEMQLAGGGRCLSWAIDCGSSTGGCGGRPFWSSCNGGAGVCVEACDSFASGGTVCECWSVGFAEFGEGEFQIAQFLAANQRPQCDKSSKISDAD